jgi:DNA end-binding protein Ku
MIEPEELDVLRPRASHAIDIEEFVDLDEIDPVYFEQPYYLVPDAKGVKPYKLLADAMTELNKVALGRIIVRSKERLVAIRPLDGMLVIETMRYADEVLPRDELLPDDDVELTDRERAMARQLVESLAAEEFQPEKFHDQYREQVLDLIERKAAGEEIVAEPMVEAPAKVLDLVAALEASLEKAQTAKERHPSASGGAAAPAKKASAKKAVKQPAKKSAAKTTKPAAKKRSA